MNDDFTNNPFSEGLDPEHTQDTHPSDQERLPIPSDNEDVEVDNSFNLNNFQVSHREFFANINEPAITFNQGKVGVNTACLKKLPSVDYVQILVNRETQMLVLRPCKESEIYSLQWCSYRRKDGKRQPRHVTGRIFFLKICDMMGWNPEHRYRVLGKLVFSNGQYLFVFNLKAREVYKKPEAAEGEKPKANRTPLLPPEWKDQFGIPYEEHQKALQINMFDGYAVFGIKDKSAEIPVTEEPPVYGETNDPYYPSEPASADEQEEAGGEFDERVDD